MMPSLDPLPVEYRFGEMRFLPSRQLLLHGNVPVRAGSRALDLLHALVSRPGELVSKEALLEAAWPNIYVHEGNLKVNIAALRRALAVQGGARSDIATVPGRGYRFVTPVQVHPLETVALDGSSGAALPAIPPVIGRDTVIDQLAESVAAHGLVTVTGPAGVGKTTVAIATAQRLAERFADGVRFVDLSVVLDPLLVGPAVATTLGITGDLTRPAEPGSTLRALNLLLVLDNCEHVLSAAVTVAELLRAQLPGVQILATSREAMRSRTERVFRLAPLAYPAPNASMGAAAALRFPAVELFVRRAAEIHAYVLDDGDAPVVGAICQRLDGLALALELAAPILGEGGATALLQRLDDSLEPLRQPDRGQGGRQRTLLETLDWSYRLLSDDEARLLRLSSVFSGAFTLEDSMGIAVPGADVDDVFAHLDGLAAKSLLSTSYQDGAPRYRLLDSTRRFAADRLRAAGEEGDGLDRFSSYMLRIADRAEEEWQWRARAEWTRAYAPYANDFRKAIDWSFADEARWETGIRLTVAAIPLWDELSTVSESRRRVERALQALTAMDLDAPGIDMKLWAAFASGLNFSDQLGPEADCAWREACRLATIAGDVEYQLRTLWGLAVLQSFSGRHTLALATLSRFDEIAEREHEHSAIPDGQRLELMTRFYRDGDADVRGPLEVLEAHTGTGPGQARVARFQIDRLVGIRVARSMALWVGGDVEGAMATADAALARAQDLGHMVSHSNALAQAALPIALGIGALDVVRGHIRTLNDNLSRLEIPIWVPVSRFYGAALRAREGDGDAVLDMRTATDTLVRNNFLVRVPYYLGLCAEAALQAGRMDLARDSIDEALIRAERQEERWSQPLLLRVEGMLQWEDGAVEVAQETLQRAIRLAGTMGALSFQVQAAVTLARLLLERGRVAAGADALRPLLAKRGIKSTEGAFAEAGALLAQMDRQCRQDRHRSR
jgi:predicted ATPase/DNA-binding winged helix-turn-helix (wHTH) protein